jgi:hypothetical protein
VYGARTAEAARQAAGRITKDPGIVKFEGEAAKLFKPHPIQGFFSGGLKALGRGEYRASPGDIKFSDARYSPAQRTLTVSHARISPHTPAIPKLAGVFGEQSRRGGRLFFDQLPTGILWAGATLLGPTIVKGSFTDIGDDSPPQSPTRK